MTHVFSDPMVVSGLNTSAALLLKVKHDPESDFIEFSAQDLQVLLAQKEESTPKQGPFIHLDNWAPSPVAMEVNLYAAVTPEVINTAEHYYVILTQDTVSDLEDYFAAQPVIKPHSATSASVSTNA